MLITINVQNSDYQHIINKNAGIPIVVQYTIEEASALTGMSKTGLRSRCARGKLPYTKKLGRILLEKNDVELIRSQRQRAN